MKINKTDPQPPEIESVTLTETRRCADIRCLAQHTEQAEQIEDLDQAFRDAGWSDQPFLGQHLCPIHARGATVRMGAMRDAD